MAMEVFEGDRVQKLFDRLEAQKAILSTCTDLYKTLTSHFSSLDQSLSHQSQTLDSKIQSLQSQSHETLSLLENRERSLPDRIASLSDEIEARKQAALSEFENPAPEAVDLVKTLTSLCRKMDAPGLLNSPVWNRKDSVALSEAIGKAIEECVDPPRFVLDVVDAFITSKAAAKKASGSGGGAGITDRRWACSMVVSGLFPQDELKVKKKTEGSAPAFSGRTLQRAMDVIERWKEKLEGDADLWNGVGQAEVAIFLQVVIGFRLKEKLDQEFLKKLVLEFAVMRKIMPKLAIRIFLDQIGDIIDELVNTGKEIEAVYFASEAGLIERFQPASLLNTYLNKSKGDVADKGSNNLSSTDETINLEMKSIKSVIKCVGELALEKQFPLDDLRKKLSSLERTKGNKKKKSVAPIKPSNKRAHGAGGRRTCNQPASRPTKAAKISNSYPSFAQRSRAPPPHQSPAARYPGAYNYPTQAAYDTPLATASYSSIYVGSLTPSSSALPQPHYTLSANNVGAPGSHLSGSTTLSHLTSYNPYNFGAASVPSAYEP